MNAQSRAVSAIVGSFPPKSFDLLSGNLDTLEVTGQKKAILRINGAEPFVVEADPQGVIRVKAEDYGPGLVRVEVWGYELDLT